MTDKEREIEDAYKELASTNTISEPDKKVDYWADYEEAQWVQYEEEFAKKLEEQAKYDEEYELKEREKQRRERLLRQRINENLWDVSGDDSSLNPSFW